MKKRILALTSALILTLSSISLAKPSIDTDYIKSLLDVIDQNYLYNIENKDYTDSALKGIFKTLDPYSDYYTEEEYKKLTENLTGEIGAGIGVVLTEKEEGIVTIEVMSKNPAEIAGVKAGDVVISIDGKDTKELSIDEASSLIRGELDTKVNLGILRDNKKMNFIITRKLITSNPVEWKEIDKNTGYIKIKEFNQNATTKTLNALREFDKKNIKNIVFDVRDNPGGYLFSVLTISKAVAPKGAIVHIKESSGKITTHSSFNDNAKYNLMVLTNEDSASASEIFAGVVQDRGIGKVVGTKTFGKGTVQDIVPLKRGGAIKLTVAEYFTPNMNKVNGVGITPDIVVKDISEDKNIDKILQTAIEELKKK